MRAAKKMLWQLYRMSYLETSPELAATLQKAQTAWVQFRDANCAYLRSIARPSYADEAFQNCILRNYDLSKSAFELVCWRLGNGSAAVGYFY